MVKNTASTVVAQNRKTWGRLVMAEVRARRQATEKSLTNCTTWVDRLVKKPSTHVRSDWGQAAQKSSIRRCRSAVASGRRESSVGSCSKSEDAWANNRPTSSVSSAISPPSSTNVSAAAVKLRLKCKRRCAPSISGSISEAMPMASKNGSSQRKK